MRDLSEAYDYARKRESEGGFDHAKEEAVRQTKHDVKLELKQAKASTRKKLQPYNSKKRHVIAGISIAAAAVIVAVITLPALNAQPADRPVESAQQTATAAAPSEVSAVPTEVSNEAADAVTENEIPQEIPEQETPVSAVQSYHGYNLGDIVMYTGTVHYATSETDQLLGPATAGTAMISAINPDGKHPFHLVHTDDTSNLYGWVDEGFLTPA